MFKSNVCIQLPQVSASVPSLSSCSYFWRKKAITRHWISKYTQNSSCWKMCVWPNNTWSEKWGKRKERQRLTERLNDFWQPPMIKLMIHTLPHLHPFNHCTGTLRVWKWGNSIGMIQGIAKQRYSRNSLKKCIHMS